MNNNLNQKDPLAAHTLPWFAVLALVVGAAPFAVMSESVRYPNLLIGSLCGLAAAFVLTRLPVMRRHAIVRMLLEVLALLLFASLIATSTGGLESYWLALFLLPLAAAAIVLSRFGFLLTAILVLIAYIVLGRLTPHTDITSSLFIIRLIGNLAPALITTGAISLLMTQVQDAEKQIRDLSTTDALTGLYNLRSFEQILEHTHAKAERSHAAYSIAVIELENLDQIKEAHGADASNQLIVSVATAIQRSIRNADALARLGPNEFAAVLFDADDAKAKVIGQRIRNNVYSGTISIANRLIRANVNIGMASYPKQPVAPDELFASAELRMRQDREFRKPG
ncbi:MAG TPA: GGDEF domain-containing protein [Steroidobacteraceae bacterium]|nr:GGDEF domain-containing protein [Steroidobacteraceae bacterium]